MFGKILFSAAMLLSPLSGLAAEKGKPAAEHFSPGGENGAPKGWQIASEPEYKGAVATEKVTGTAKENSYEVKIAVESGTLQLHTEPMPIRHGRMIRLEFDFSGEGTVEAGLHYYSDGKYIGSSSAAEIGKKYRINGDRKFKIAEDLPNKLMNAHTHGPVRPDNMRIFVRVLKNSKVTLRSVKVEF